MSTFMFFCFLSALTFLIKLFVSVYLVDSSNAILLANSTTLSLAQIFYNAITTALWCGGLLLPVWYLKTASVMREFGLDSQISNIYDPNTNDT